MATGNAKVCGVIGNPVGHSLSPLMHNEIAKAMGLDYIYVPCPVEEDAVGDAVRGAYALGFEGLNVTVPYKQRVIPFLAEMDESARCIGACNTLVRLHRGDCEVQEENENTALDEIKNGAEGRKGCTGYKGYRGYKGYNTDAEGLFRAMQDRGMEICGRDCLLIGAGGAARAAAYLLIREGAASVTILNRSPDKAEALATDMRRMAAERSIAQPGEDGQNGRRSRITAVNVLSPERWRQLPQDSYLAVQTTSVGMYPHVDASPIEDRDFYKKIAQAVDVIYTPSRTRFMEYTEAAGGSVLGGLDMLIYQGVAALELWNPGVKVPREVVTGVRRIMEGQLHG